MARKALLVVCPAFDNRHGLEWLPWTRFLERSLAGGQERAQEGHIDVGKHF
jgi:hypothetical protein